MVAAVNVVSIKTGATMIQIIDPATGQVRSFEPPVNQFNTGGGCAFAGGLLYAGTGLSIGYLDEYSIIAAIDPIALAVVNTWNPIGIGNLIALAGSPTGQVYAVSQTHTQTCALVSENCATELDALNSDGTSATLSQWTDPAGAIPIYISPNGTVYVSSLGYYRQNNLPLPGVLMTYCGIAWPSSDPLYALVCDNGKQLNTLNVFTGQVPLMLSTTYAYSTVAAQRQSDGTDLVPALRNGALDIYRATPPSVAYYVANGATYQPGGITPNSWSTVFVGLPALQAQVCGYPYPQVCGNVRVRLDHDGKSEFAELYYVSATQINLYVPGTVSIGTAALTATVQRLNTDGTWTSVNPLTTDILSAAPAIFTDGNGNALIVHADGTVNSQGAPGEIVSVYGSGLGPVAPGSYGLSWTTITTTVSIGVQPNDVSAQVTFSGLSPCCTGLYQVNFVIPGAAVEGVQPIMVEVGTADSPSAKIKIFIP